MTEISRTEDISLKTDYMIDVMEDFVDGASIQVRSLNGMESWVDTKEPSWNWVSFEYRVKPKDKIKVYLYSYTSGSGKWVDTITRYKNDSDFIKHHPSITEFKRLDYTMIEVDE